MGSHLSYAVNFHPSPLPEGRGPYRFFRRPRSAFRMGHVGARDRPDLRHRRHRGAAALSARGRRKPRLLLAKCQLAAKDIARSLADDLPGLWREAKPQGRAAIGPVSPPRSAMSDWTKNVDDVLRTIRAFGSIDMLRPDRHPRRPCLGSRRLAAGPPEIPGTLVHRHRRHLVIAARDGFVQLTGWSASPPGTTRRG